MTATAWNPPAIRAYLHGCGGLVLVDQAGPVWRYLDRHERPITHCPRCRRRLTRSRLTLLARTVRHC